MIVVIFVALFLGACVSPETAVLEVDSAAYSLIAERSEELFGESSDFRIDPPVDSLRQKIIRGEIFELPNLNLVDCLEISAENSREYQSQKESLYRSALALTLERWNYGFQFGFGGDLTLSGSGDSGNVSFSASRLFGTGAMVLADVGTSLLEVVSGGDGWSSLRNASFNII